MVRAFTEDFDRSKQDETEETVCLSKDEPSQPAKEWVVLRKSPQGKRLSTRPFSFSPGTVAGGPWRGGEREEVWDQNAAGLPIERLKPDW